MGAFRLFLAIVVAYDHWRAIILFPAGVRGAWPLFGFHAGQAVLFFYVISGFLITFTLTKNYAPDAAGQREFYKNRFIRIFSLYWPAAAFSIVMFGGLFSTGALDALTKIFLFGQDWLAAFGPFRDGSDFSGMLTGLHQSWTLGAELTFYLIAPFVARNWKLAVVLCAASLMCRGAILLVIGDAQAHPHWTYYFFPATLCFFMFGQLACLASLRWTALLRPAFALLTPAIFVITPVMLVVQYKVLKITSFDNVALWIPIILFVVSLPALFEATKNSRALNYLGNLSYPLYLVHTFVLMFASEAIVRHLLPYGGIVTAMAFVAFSVAAAAVLHSAIERPFAWAMRLALRDSIRWKSSTAAKAPAE